jgi:hypothetical protein
MNARTYSSGLRLLDNRQHHLENLVAIQQRMASAERGELKPAEQVLAGMRVRYDIPV